MSDWLWDHVLIPFITRVPGWVVVAAALFLYPGLGLAAPLLLSWPTPWLVDANHVGVTFVGLISLGWLVVQLQAAHRRHLVEWTTDLRRLTAEEFEWFVGEVFRRDDWDVKETGRQDGPDGNIDLVLTRGRERRLVQCKRWDSRLIGVNAIRAFAGTLSREGLHTRQGVFVTLSDFTKSARAEARQMGMKLIDHRELFAMVEKARRPEPCPSCNAPMTLDRSQHGWWFRCTTAGCAGKRHLHAEPARAVELLTQRPWRAETTDA